MRKLTHIWPLVFGIVVMLVASNLQQIFAQCPGSVYAGEDSVICYSSSRVYLNGKVIRPNGKLAAGHWTGGTGRFIPDSNTLNAVYIPSPSEEYNGVIQLILVPAQNCVPSKSDTVTITINRVIDPPITGPLGICEYSSGHTYSVPQESGISYNWHIVGGSINSGNGTHAVDVSWGAKGPGYIYVIQTDSHGCNGVSSIEPISRFHFNTTDYKRASVGPDALSIDPDAMGDGVGLYINNNCGPTKGLDLTLAGGAFDRGKMCMTFSWQRDESEASFFKRGGTEFHISGGVLRVKLTQKDSVGNAKVVGPINTGYTVPNDDVFRHFTFCYDSASGIARVLVNDSLVWNYETGTHSSLHWTGAGNAVIGSIMDGNCSKKTLLDWVNVSIPISIYPKPTPQIFGDTLLCKNAISLFIADSNAFTELIWNAGANGSIIGQNNVATVNAKWNQAGFNTLNLVVTDSRNGCDSSVNHNVTISELPQFSITGMDSICAGDSSLLQITGIANNPIWHNHTQTDSSTHYLFKGMAGGNYPIYLDATDSLNFCTNSDTIALHVRENPDPQILIPQIICLGETILLQDTANHNWTVNHSWNITGADILSGQNNSEFLIKCPNPGNQSGSLTIRDAQLGCETVKQFQLNVKPKPVTGDIKFD